MPRILGSNLFSCLDYDNLNNFDNNEDHNSSEDNKSESYNFPPQFESKHETSNYSFAKSVGYMSNYDVNIIGNVNFKISINNSVVNFQIFESTDIPVTFDMIMDIQKGNGNFGSHWLKSMNYDLTINNKNYLENLMSCEDCDTTVYEDNCIESYKISKHDVKKIIDTIKMNAPDNDCCAISFYEEFWQSFQLKYSNTDNSLIFYFCHENGDMDGPVQDYNIKISLNNTNNKTIVLTELRKFYQFLNA